MVLQDSLRMGAPVSCGGSARRALAALEAWGVITARMLHGRAPVSTGCGASLPSLQRVSRAVP